MSPINTDLPAEEPKASSWNESVKTILTALLLALLFRSLFFEPFHIPSGSMKSNLLVGDYLFVSKYSYGYSRFSFPLGFPIFKGRIMETLPKRGDVVVFRVPTNNRVDFIKRIMGLPGDRIQVRSGIVYINDQALPRTPLEPYMDNEMDYDHPQPVPRLAETLPEGKVIQILKERRFGAADDTPVYTVPPAHYFMMGDNRDNSRDSRYQDEVGFVPEENLVGRAEIIFFSIDGSARWNRPDTWIGSLRYNRFFHLID